MKVFVTVGTTTFDSLIRYSDIAASIYDKYEFVFQKAKSDYIPINGLSFEFVDNIDEYYNNADIVITHAGAGTIYRLLELNKKVIVVPNLERVDKHQLDIAQYMGDNKHLLVCYELNNLSNIIEESNSFNPRQYLKKHFFKDKEIIDFIKEY
ncbi:PssE/Cps14G family polysaccharide biosynthesis glycosyltransferase [Photobacterium leiognathi]|uniref:PssE/Cps14G family polysaccharide biosynthesis glycosyltransferase n=1 Tax=Photobacterium leiognathi TaxID=553611 RepID=UPI0029816111|nr:PssE/Cps14G family polysaccharide biosynthesis glycosyltransferase [Photobacterium leiognathi]